MTTHFQRETARAHKLLLAAGYVRNPEEDIRGREGMRAYIRMSDGAKALQSSGLTVLMPSRGSRIVVNTSEQLAARLRT